MSSSKQPVQPKQELDKDKNPSAPQLLVEKPKYNGQDPPPPPMDNPPKLEQNSSQTANTKEEKDVVESQRNDGLFAVTDDWKQTCLSILQSTKNIDSNVMTFEMSQNVKLYEEVEMAASLLATWKTNADLIKECKKDVHFSKGIPNYEGLLIHCASGGANGEIIIHTPTTEVPLTAVQIAKSDFLWVAPMNVRYDPQAVQIIKNMNIAIKDAIIKQPTRLLFTSGGTYILSDGYSVNHCRYLHRSAEITLIK